VYHFSFLGVRQDTIFQRTNQKGGGQALPCSDHHFFSAQWLNGFSNNCAIAKQCFGLLSILVTQVCVWLIAMSISISEAYKVLPVGNVSET